MSIAIAGIIGFRNRGVEALAQPVLEFLQGQTPSQWSQSLPGALNLISSELSGQD